MSDRKTGAILTPSMREFYRETPDQSGSKARTTRQRTRDRFVAALEDIDLLFGTIRDEDRRAIIDRIDARQLDDYLEKFIALFARELDIGRLEEIIERAFRRALALEGYPAAEVTVTATVVRDPADVSDVIAKIERGEELTRKETAAVAFAGPDDVSKEDIETLLDTDDEPWADIGERLEEEKEPIEKKD